jgi:phosphoribosylanthranilate isomerase
LRVKTKICGITRLNDLNAAVTAGADALGFIVGVPSSKRNLSLNKAAMLVKKVPVFVSSVLVTVQDSIDILIEAYDIIRPNILQIHGGKIPKVDELRETFPNSAIIRGIRSKPGKVLTDVKEISGFDAILLDTFDPGNYGGTGKVHNWYTSERISRILDSCKIILAGGLNPSNVKEAIGIVKPYAVDVSTGVESSPGIKDHEKIALFINNVREVEL